ncbi:efflux RND transporter permease subunit [Cupriavidus metallidurans]|uniref:Heavy metal cation tricomponent efflux efflux pump ZniA (CzcA-like) n=1 Tax=Cupriavidus metallidurans (strain ATCC 43123 / DSM 2839 / NBRC 102507 / CH34) TaxID=266264 RepID=Q1LCE8_CUPMC|nr:CusA/CzcA family heavy metal efflux RND transporter [Cupriavidus metallidurans]ABF12178.1 heavy metal cation tricomponent efflux efflux pump ZniA (CzcA-like) [Cupriavidus metallidurans CH34]QGS32568.1 CusA/CzcA family heavy metal efflux RND transporter [Cupriavidus metallidurans]
MLRNVLRLSLTRRPLILLFLLVFAGAGLFAYSKLNIEAYPNPAPVILEITAQAPGLSAEEMERYYTVPMEVGLAATPGVESIRSTSFYGLSFVRVTFKYGVDYYFAYTQAALNLQQNVSLPNNVQPQIQASSLVGEIYRYQLRGPAHFGLTNLRTLQDWVLERRLKTVPGVAQVVSWGGTTKEYDVEADLHKLDAYNITLQQMISALGNANINVGGRTINLGQQSVNIRGVGLIEDTKDIEQVVLTQHNGVPVQVKDVAKVKIGYTPRLGRSGRDNQDDVVTAIVVMNRTLQTNEVVARVKAEIDKINSDGTLPAGVKMEPYYDRSTLVSVTTHTVLHSLLFGCLLVFFIQWVFLGDLRSAVIVSVNIPFALFFSIMILVMLGESANLLSVGAVDFGIIVDSSVILVENIFRNFQMPLADQQRLLMSRDARAIGKGAGITDRIRMIFVSALQVDKAVFFSAAITVAAFVPLFTMQGVEGQIFGPMARTYGYALLGALIATFTVTPVLCTYLLPKHIEEKETILVRWLHRIYEPALKWSLGNKKLSVAIGAGVLAVTGALMPLLGTEFLPALEEGNLWIRATMPPTVSLEAGVPSVARMRKILLSHPEVATVVSQHGRPDDGSDAAGFFNAEFFVPLKPMDEWPAGMTKDKLVAQVQKEFANEFTGISLNFSQYIQDNVQEGLSGVKGANSVKIVGRDLPTLEKLADQVLHEMKEIRGVSDLGVFRVLGQPNLNIKINREAAARYGLNTGDVNSVVEAALGGTQATTVLEGDRQFSLTVRMAPEYRGSIDAIRNIKVAYQTADGANAYIPLSALADISLDTGASYIYHERNQRYIPIKFSVRDRDLGSTVAEAQARIASKIKLPEGYRIQWAGEFEQLELAKKRLALIVPISIVMIMVLLYGLFNSLRDSVMTLAGIPFAIAGGVIALFVTGLDFSISAAIGFVSLFGVSVMDGILMITYYNQLREQGLKSEAAMSQAAQQRMRPMLMTALSACIGLLPAAISTGIGSQVQRPLATVVVGGMLIGPIMLLVIVPALRMVFIGKKET